ncbi:MAG: DUF116 domain-containing protein [Candidatus ainarchaeum sp.]|nr:DUF116 domain-containing protein [Candidatus ainarchaeum sp.]
MADGLTAKIRASISKLIDSGAHLDAYKTTEIIAKKLGLSQRMINYTHIEIRNTLNEFGFKSAPYPERVLFLPHCLKNSEKCRAKYTDEGLQCMDCGACQVPELKKIAKELGYKAVFITPGGSMVEKLIEKHRPKAVLGLCCYEEANLAFDKLKGKNIAPQAVLLLRDGCRDTLANIEEVKEKMQMADKKIFEANSANIE